MSDAPAPSQIDKLKEVARQLEGGHDPEQFKGRVERLVRHSREAIARSVDRIEESKSRLAQGSVEKPK